MEPFPPSWPKAAGHPPRYRWHKYWGRKPHNVVAAVLAHRLVRPGTVLDLFSGSGVAATEALLLGHRAVALDLNPVAIGILRQTVAAPPLAAMDAAMARIQERAAAAIDALYATACRQCGRAVTLACAVWERGQLADVRYQCPHCGHRGLDEPPNDQDVALATGDAADGLPDWPLCHVNGERYQEAQRTETVRDLFVPRARRALALLREAIAAEPADLQPTLGMVLTSVLHLVSQLCPVAEPGPTNHATPFSSFWAQHSFNTPSRAMEQPVWRKFHAGYWGHQGWRKAQLDALGHGAPYRLAADARSWAEGLGDLWTGDGPALQRLEELQRAGARFDLIFSDPPYGGSIQYGELSTLWNAFLSPAAESRAYQDAMAAHEVVCSRPQAKDLAVFRRDLQAHFAAARHLLQPDGSLVVTFHNPKGALRHAAIGAIVSAGFQLQAIRHDPGARLSSKACQQPFGSVEGDFWLHFTPGGEAVPSGRHDWAERVIALTERLLLEAEGPLSYTELSNRLDPALAAEGFFAYPEAPVSVDGVLKTALGQHFQVQPAEGGKGLVWSVLSEEALTLGSPQGGTQ